jgi:hypothetical protein
MFTEIVKLKIHASTRAKSATTALRSYVVNKPEFMPGSLVKNADAELNLWAGIYAL